MWMNLLKKRNETTITEEDHNSIITGYSYDQATMDHSSPSYYHTHVNESIADEMDGSNVGCVAMAHSNSLSDCSQTSLVRTAAAAEQSIGYTYSRGQSALSQTLIRGLHNPPSMSFVTSIRSAYNSVLIQTTRPDEDQRQEADASADAGEWTVPPRTLLESSGTKQWSAYNNAHRTVPVWVAGWNVINLIQGAGVLAVPYACFHAGWMSIPIVCFVAMISCYTGHLVGECLYDKPRHTVTGYRELSRTRVRSTLACIAADAMPRGGRRLTSTVVVLDMFGAAVLYLLLLGRSLAMLLEPAVDVHWPVSYWTLLGGCLQIPLVLCPSLHIIAWFSMLAMIGLHSCIAIGMAYCIQQAQSSSILGLYLPAPTVDHLPIAISIIVFSYTAHAALPGIEGSMKRPGYYPKMLNVAFTLASAIKLSFGLLCAIVIGPELHDSVADSLAGNRSQLAIAMNACVAVSVFFSCPLFFHILGEQADSSIAPHVRRGFLSHRTCISIYAGWFVGTRGTLLTLAVLIAVLVPRFATIIGFLGAITGCCLSFILPCLFSLILFWSRLSFCAKSGRILIATFGLVAGIFGVIASATNL